MRATGREQPIFGMNENWSIKINFLLKASMIVLSVRCQLFVVPVPIVRELNITSADCRDVLIENDSWYTYIMTVTVE